MDSNVTETLNNYLRDGIHTVNGWCLPHLWQSLWPLAQLAGPGPIAEIGVFEGKFFIGLAKTFGARKQHAAIDVFNLQHFNLDGAGTGKLDIFQSNMEIHGTGPGNVTCLQRDSLTLGTEDTLALREKFGGFKCFSVDGCHEKLHTMHDVEFAMSVTDSKGIIAVDDFLNPDWPGVNEAISKMYLLREFSFVPLLFTCGKLFLCSRSYHDSYRNHVAQYVRHNFPGTRVKEVPRYGYTTLTIIPDQTVWQEMPTQE